MRPRVLKPTIGTLVCLALLGFSSNCGNFQSQLNELVNPPFVVIGEGESKLYFLIPLEKTSPTPNDILVGQVRPSDVYSLELGSLNFQRVKAGITVGRSAFTRSRAGLDIVANGRWLVWIDREARAIRVMDHMIGTESNLDSPVSETVLGDPFSFILLEVQGNRLVTFVSHQDAMGEDFVIIDLETGSQLTIGDSLVYASYALSGGHFALFNNQPTTVSALELELTTNLDVVDLATGERTTVAPNLRISGDGGKLVSFEGVFAWDEFRPGKFRTKVRSFDTKTETLSTIADPLGGEDEQAWLLDINADSLLIERSRKEALLSPRLIELRRANGRIEIAARNGLFIDPASALVAPRLVGRFAVWGQNNGTEIVIFDTELGTQQVFSPADSTSD